LVDRNQETGSKLPEPTEGTAEGTAPKPAADASSRSNWPLLRKFETLIFACLLALLPFFAANVVEIIATSLAVKKSEVDLVNDLAKSKRLAKEHAVNISLVSRRGNNMLPPAYLIQDEHRNIEEVVLPAGVSIDGSVKFDKDGIPERKAVFEIAKGMKKARVYVDENGIVSAP
jgi:hypothetical protein